MSESGREGQSRPKKGKPSSTPTRKRTGALPITISILFIAAIAVTGFSQVWTDILWFNQLGFARVLWTQWIASALMALTMGLLTALAVWLSMRFAYRARPLRVPSHDERAMEVYQRAIEPMRRVLAWLVPLGVGLFVGFTQAMPHWREILLAFNSSAFGVKDPQWGLDVSFYIFILPLLRTLIRLLVSITVTAAIFSVGTHYLYGGITFAPRFTVTRSARVQLTIFAAIYCLTQAVNFWLQRYSLLFDASGRFDGATYTDVHANIPAKTILAAISVVIAALFIASIWMKSWKLPITGVVVMVVSSLVIGSVYPAVVQKFVVDPNAQRSEAPYIQRNIDATLAAYGLDKTEITAYNAKTDASAGQLKADAESTASIRLLDPSLVTPTFRQLQQNRQYYNFSSQLNVDRYQVSGTSRDTVIAVRELNLAGLSQDQHTWVNDHTVYTHGYGVVSAYGNTVASGGYPSFWEGGIPSTGDLGVYEPRIYFGQQSPNYSIVGGTGNAKRELDYPDDSTKAGQVNTTFTGNGGPNVGNPFNKFMYAVKFREMNILFSKEVGAKSQILYVRDPAARVQKVAPWLTLDAHPYPAVVDTDGDPKTPKRVVWILDGYTTSNNYPYAAHESLKDATADARSGSSSLVGADTDKANYVRNSVKAVVDAYDGSVTLYEWDQKDPIVKAWGKVFPGSVTSMSKMSADLMAHMRYPEDLFKLQRTVMARYHVRSADEFYSGGDFWKVPDDPTRRDAGAQAPYYLTLKMPGQEKASFSLSSVYIIGGTTDRNVLTGFIAVDSETSSGKAGVRNPNYGKIRLLELPRSSNVSGPGQVQNKFSSDANVSQTLNLLAQQSSQVLRGNLLTLPVGGGLLYVQPVYVQSSSGTQYPLLRKVLVLFGEKVGFADTLNGALDQVFGGDSGAKTGEQIVNGDNGAANNTNKQPAASPGASAAPSASASPTASSPTASTATSKPATGTPAGGNNPALSQALADAKKAMQDSNDAMKRGDWSAYGDAQKRLQDAIERATKAQGN